MTGTCISLHGSGLYSLSLMKVWILKIWSHMICSLSYAYQSVWMFLCHNQFHTGKTIARRQNEKGVIRTKFKSYYFATFLKGTEDM